VLQEVLQALPHDEITSSTNVVSFVWGLSVFILLTTTFNCIDTNVLIIEDLPAKSPINLRGLLFLHRLASSPTNNFIGFLFLHQQQTVNIIVSEQTEC
jgi:hypothetical protein